ncbi:35102_t:CDS:2, partial [Racocetra persica]
MPSRRNLSYKKEKLNRQRIKKRFIQQPITRHKDTEKVIYQPISITKHEDTEKQKLKHYLRETDLLKKNKELPMCYL